MQLRFSEIQPRICSHALTPSLQKPWARGRLNTRWFWTPPVVPNLSGGLGPPPRLRPRSYAFDVAQKAPHPPAPRTFQDLFEHVYETEWILFGGHEISTPLFLANNRGLTQLNQRKVTCKHPCVKLRRSPKILICVMASLSQPEKSSLKKQAQPYGYVSKSGCAAPK